MSDTEKQKILYNKEFIEKNKISDYELKDIIDSFTDEKKLQILADSSLIVEKLNLKNYQISELICNLPNENSKRKILEGYSFENNTLLDIICTFTNESKEKIILDENTFDIRDKNRFLSSLDVESLINFLLIIKIF